MILGIGTDIIEIERVKKAAENERFVKKVFTEKEQNYFSAKSAQSMAGGFAAKEAVAKALGTGISGFSLTDIEVLHDDKGKPVAFLHNNAKIIFDNLGALKVHLSISHCSELAVAYAVIEG